MMSVISGIREKDYVKETKIFQNIIQMSLSESITFIWVQLNYILKNYICLA